MALDSDLVEEPIQHAMHLYPRHIRAPFPGQRGVEVADEMEEHQTQASHEEKRGIIPHHFPTATDVPTVSLDLLASLLEFSPDASLVVDAAGTIVLLNVQAASLFGYAREELRGQLLEVLLPQHLHGVHVAERLHYMDAPRARPMGTGLNLVGRRKDGSTFPVDISLRPFLIGQALHVMGAIRDMTAQHQAARERAYLTEQLQQQNQLLALSYDAVLVCDPQGQILSWNRGAEVLYGWNEHEAVGCLAEQLLSTRFVEPLDTIEVCLERDGHWEGDLMRTRRDGREVRVESRQTLVRTAAGEPTALLEINRDVTELRRLEQVEQETRAETAAHLALLQLLLDRLPTGVCLAHGPEARLLLANHATAQLWGAEWQLGQPLQEFLTTHQIRVARRDGQPLAFEQLAVMRALRRCETVQSHQEVIRHPDGTTLPVLAHAVPVDLRGLTLFGEHVPHSATEAGTCAALVVYQDVSALMEAERLKDEFISLATHELRNPLTVLAGYAELLLRRDAQGKGHGLDQAQRDTVSAMKEAAQQLAKLTEDLLDVTRLQTGHFPLQRMRTELVTLTRQVIANLQATAPRHQITLQTSYLSLWASVDALRFTQILSNVLSNAIKYSPQGGPIEVHIWEEEQTHEACFSVRDTGMGIPRAQQAHLFGRFVRAENVRMAGIRGTGLGLYLCRELVERHGGRIWFQSEEHVGSTFVFTIPLVEGVE